MVFNNTDLPIYNMEGFAMNKVLNYSYLFRSMFGIKKNAGSINRIRVSDLSNKSVQAQLRAAGIDTNSKRYKSVISQMTKNADGKTMYTNARAIKNLMKQYNKDGDYVGPNGIVVPGMCATGIPESERHQIIDVSEEARQKMFDETKRHFLQEYGVGNGRTTKRSEVYREFQLGIPKEDRLKGTWTLGQYERAYRQAFCDAVRAVDPDWTPGDRFSKKVLDGITRESVDNALVQSGESLTLPRKTFNIGV